MSSRLQNISGFRRHVYRATLNFSELQQGPWPTADCLGMGTWGPEWVDGIRGWCTEKSINMDSAPGKG